MSLVTHDIIERCKKQEAAAQRQLFESLSGQLLGVCVRYLKTRELAEDCLQEVFIKIFSNIAKYRGDGPFEAWARRIAVNEIMSQFRTKNVLDTAVDYEEVEIENSSADVMGDISHKQMLYFINLLPEGKKVVFNLYVIEGYSHKEIAQMLDITEGTSKSQLSKAKEMLVKLHRKYNLTHEERNA